MKNKLFFCFPVPLLCCIPSQITEAGDGDAFPGDEACGTRAVRQDKASISWQHSRTAAARRFLSAGVLPERRQKAGRGGRKLTEEAESWPRRQSEALARAAFAAMLSPSSHGPQASQGLSWLPRQGSSLCLGSQSFVLVLKKVLMRLF